MSFEVINGDITRMEVDAVVNAANTSLAPGGGVSGAIFAAAGVDELTAACRALAPIQTGEAVITPGFNLPARHIVHTAGPVYEYGDEEGMEALRNCYLNSLALAQEHGCTSIAFPLISSGIYGYPVDIATKIATKAINDWLAGNEMTVYLVLFR